jgi:hypothetical protein
MILHKTVLLENRGFDCFLLQGRRVMANKQISVILAPHVHASLEKLAKEKGLKKSAIITIALEKYVREEERNNGR